MYVAKTKALISYVVTVLLIRSVPLFWNLQKRRFSHDAALLENKGKR